MLEFEVPLCVKGFIPTLLEKEYIFIVHSYNFGERLLRCLASIDKVARGHNVGVLVLDDGSVDFHKVEGYVDGMTTPCVLLRFQDNHKKAHNIYAVTRSLSTLSSILVFVDGDDYLNTDLPVMGILKKAYSTPECDATFGSFSMANTRNQDRVMTFGTSCPIKSDFSKVWDPDECWCWCHLKTMRASLLLSVEEEYYTEADNLTFIRCGDDNLLFPRAYQKARHVEVIHEKIYVYDTSSDHPHINDISRYGYVRDIFLKKKYKAFHPLSQLSLEVPSWRKRLNSSYKTYRETPKDTIIKAIIGRIRK